MILALEDLFSTLSRLTASMSSCSLNFCTKDLSEDTDPDIASIFIDPEEREKLFVLHFLV